MRVRLIFTLMSIAALGAANDAWVGYSGSPKLMKGHPTVRMVSEVVKITVYKEYLLADCRFVFKNEGPATSVRMGFPDWASSDDGIGPKKSNYTWFKSNVNGKAVKTKLVGGRDYGDGFQIKDVAFRRGETKTVRDRYRMRIAIAATSEGDKYGFISGVEYILHTGASWKGKIGRSEVIVNFKKESGFPVRPNPTSDLGVYENRGGYQVPDFWMKDKNRVYYEGPTKPVVRGRSMRFVRKNWEPAADENVAIWFGWKYTG